MRLSLLKLNQSINTKVIATIHDNESESVAEKPCIRIADPNINDEKVGNYPFVPYAAFRGTESIH